MLTVKAYAKINLALDVHAKRPDGYHQVEMIMQSVSLADTVTITEGGAGITVTASNAELPCDSSNLAWRAADLVRQALHIDKGVHIHLEKQIPLAAGLAGGSSNAAAVLKGLDKLWQLGLSTDQLEELGARLGSDVPFCLNGGTMLATGRGERLTSLPDMPHSWVVLAKPPVAVSTAWVYGNFKADNVTSRPDIVGMIEGLQKGNYDAVTERLANVLESVTIPAHPDVARLKQLMAASGVKTLMSGSGPTVFGLVRDKETAFALAKELERGTTAQVFVAETVGRGDGENAAFITN